METRKRAITKTITFRIAATLTTMLIVFIFTNNLVLMGIVGVLEIISKLIIYYVHERAWNRISWGRKRIITTEITTEEAEEKKL